MIEPTVQEYKWSPEIEKELDSLWEKMTGATGVAWRGDMRMLGRQSGVSGVYSHMIMTGMVKAHLRARGLIE